MTKVKSLKPDPNDLAEHIAHPTRYWGTPLRLQEDSARENNLLLQSK